MPQYLPFAFGQWLDRHRSGLIRQARPGRELGGAWDRCEQELVGVGQHRITPEHRFDPAALDSERQPKLLALSQPQRGTE